MKDTNMREIENLWYRISKSGAVFNISETYAEIIIGIPPPHLTNLSLPTPELVSFNISETYAEIIIGIPPPHLTNLSLPIPELVSFLSPHLLHHGSNGPVDVH